jgi:hypothetical protein
VIEMARVLDALERSAHTRNPGATGDELAATERALGRTLPDDVRAFYRWSNGCYMVGGNLNAEPLLPSADEPDGLAVATSSARLREQEWPIPDELVVFGGNGAGDLFGVWLPAGGEARPIVVMVGVIFGDERAFAVVGDDLASFMAGWLAFYLLIDDELDVAPALAALGVPDELRHHDEPDMDALLHWASPLLPPGDPDPYGAGRTAAEVAELAR